MALHCCKTLPKTLYVAFSGGVDSVVLATLALKLKRNVRLAFFHHGNAYADVEYQFAQQFATQRGLHLEVAGMPTVVRNREHEWRHARYEFFQSLPHPVATGHHLDDAVEWYLMTCLKGEGHYMLYQNNNVFRPMLLQRKETIQHYAEENGLTWIDDPSNHDVDFATRNRVRHLLLPQCLEINPGLHETVRRHIRNKIHPPKDSTCLNSSCLQP